MDIRKIKIKNKNSTKLAYRFRESFHEKLRFRFPWSVHIFRTIGSAKISNAVIIKYGTRTTQIRRGRRRRANTWPAAFLTNVGSSEKMLSSKTFPHPEHHLQLQTRTRIKINQQLLDRFERKEKDDTHSLPASLVPSTFLTQLGHHTILAPKSVRSRKSNWSFLVFGSR